MSDFHPLTNLRRFVTDLTRGQTVIPAEHYAAAEELVTGPRVTAADFDWNDAPGLTFHPSLTRELSDDNLAARLNEWSLL